MLGRPPEGQGSTGQRETQFLKATGLLEGPRVTQTGYPPSAASLACKRPAETNRISSFQTLGLISTPWGPLKIQISMLHLENSTLQCWLQESVCLSHSPGVSQAHAVLAWPLGATIAGYAPPPGTKAGLKLNPFQKATGLNSCSLG